MSSIPKKWKRLIIGLGFPLLVGMVAVYVFFIRTGLQCPFYRLTGLYCPGCGSGRSVQALRNGRIREAFLYNVLLYPLGIPAACVVLHEYLRIVFPQLKLKPVFLPAWLETLCVGVILSFWLLRNLPWLSFLAP